MKQIAMRIFFIGILILAAQQYAKAQPDPDEEVPLDPGSWVLVVAGVGYGVKKWRDSKQTAMRREHGENSNSLKKENINNNP